MLKQASWFYLTLFLLGSSLFAEVPLSSIHLPDDLNQNLPFEILEASSPKLSMKWVEPSKSILVPYAKNRYISIQQQDKLWNLETQQQQQQQQEQEQQQQQQQQEQQQQQQQQQPQQQQQQQQH